MYADFFGFRELPFNNTPDPRFFYPTPDHEEALASLIYATTQRKGFVLLTGEIGAGKTLLTRMMIRHFGNAVAFANVNHSVQNPSDLMETICTEFELPFDRSDSETHLIRILHDYLLSKFAQNIPVVLVLDEAQNVSIDAFERLRMIGNLESDDAKLLQIAIVGQPELQRIFAKPGLRQLRQRIFRSFHLPALDRKATEGYIHHRLSVVSKSAKNIFSEDAIDTIFHASQGLPRVVNTICDNTLLSAYSADRKRIDSQFVDSVLSQMMLLPGGNDLAEAAMHSPAQTTADASHVTRLPGTLKETTRDLVIRAFGKRTQRNTSAIGLAPTDSTGSRTGQAKGSTPPDEISALKSELEADRKRVATLEANLLGLIDRFANPDLLQEKMERLIKDTRVILGRTETVTTKIARCEERVARVDRTVGDVVGDLGRWHRQAVRDAAHDHDAGRSTRRATTRKGGRRRGTPPPGSIQSADSSSARPSTDELDPASQTHPPRPSQKGRAQKVSPTSGSVTIPVAQDRIRQCVADVRASLDALRMLAVDRFGLESTQNASALANPVPQEPQNQPTLEPAI